jgi:hypothetical protein
VRKAPRVTPQAVLTRHFLREFLENDLISPDSDRLQLLSVVGAMVVSVTLLISVVMSFEYVIAPLLSPGQIATMALDDRFFYLALAMIVGALAAIAQWDALVVTPRDAAILEPLPVSAGTIRRAKLAAVGILGGAVAIGINAFPSLVFPALAVYTLRQLSLLDLLALVTAHALFTMIAAVYGYVTVIGIREVLTAILGRRWFTRVSPWAQGILIVPVVGSLLLLPPASEGIARRGFEGWHPMSPPMWFLGAYESLVGGVIADAPRTPMRPRQFTYDQIATERYRRAREHFPGLARRAGWTIGLTFLLAAAAYAWNASRLPSLAPAPAPAFRRRWTLIGRLVNAVLLRDPTARAGFYFALAAMWRSNTHRLTLACAAAAGGAMAVVALSNSGLTQGGGASPRLLAIQPFIYGALLVGFRHIIRVPAELRANWGFQLAWRNQESAFVRGVKRAALVALAVPALALVLPLFIFVLGLPAALLHAGLGLAGAIVLLEALMVTYAKVPFTCTYLPSENMKALAPIYAGAFLIGALVFARMQHAALLGDGMSSLLISLVVVLVIIRVLSMTRARLPYVDFDEAPATFQRLRLDT